MADEKKIKYHRNLSAAYAKSTSTVNKALSKVEKDYADDLAADAPTGPTGPTGTPTGPTGVPTGPTGTPTGPTGTPTGKWPLDLSANPTGPKKALPAKTGDITTTQNGQVIDGFNGGNITINHSNVTIRNFKAKSVLANRSGNPSTGLVLEDGIIDGENSAENAVAYSEYTARRIEVTRTVDAFKAHGNTLIEDCYIHDLFFSTNGPGGFSHNDGVQVSSGSNVTVRRTRVEGTRGNSSLYAQADQGTISNITFDSNYMNDSGNYMIYVKESVTAPQLGLVKNVTITNNIFGKRPDYLDPSWSYMMAEVRADNLVWTNNIQQSSGKQTKLDGAGKAYPV